MELSLAAAGVFLDRAAAKWHYTHKCFTCHTN
jgi:hypothetical protein